MDQEEEQLLVGQVIALLSYLRKYKCISTSLQKLDEIDCILYVYYLYVICILYAYYTELILMLYVYHMYFICILYIFYMYIICILYLYYMYIIQILFKYYMYIICILYVFHMHLICMFHSEILTSLNFNKNKMFSPGLENNHTLKCCFGNFPI